MSVDSRFKTTYILIQRKAFYRERIPQSSCLRTETFDIDILVISVNGDRKIMQSIIITSRPSWLHFDHEPRVQEKQQGKDQESCISVFVTYLTIPSSN